MYGGREFIDEIIHCNCCGFRFVQPPTPGLDYYAQVNHSGYSSLTNARLQYFAEIKSAMFKRGFLPLNKTVMLDLGAGEGDWLATWPEVHYKYATEVQPALVNRMKERGIFTAPGLEIFPRKHFNLVSAFDFLEHVEDPNTLIRQMHDLLMADGTAIFGVPDMGKWTSHIFGTRYYLYCPMHYSYFTKKSLNMLLSKYFDQIEIFTSPPMRTSLNGVAKWTFPKLQNKAFDKIWLPFGYRASLIAIARKKS